MFYNYANGMGSYECSEAHRQIDRQIDGPTDLFISMLFIVIITLSIKCNSKSPVGFSENRINFSIISCMAGELP